MEKRILDQRYKQGTDTGAMSHLAIHLPLKSYSVLKQEPFKPVLREKKIENMKRKGIAKKRREKYLKQKFNK